MQERRSNSAKKAGPLLMKIPSEKPLSEAPSSELGARTLRCARAAPHPAHGSDAPREERNEGAEGEEVPQPDGASQLDMAAE